LPNLRHTDELNLPGAAKDDVHVPAHVAKPLIERRRVRIPGTENEPVIATQASHRNEPERLSVQFPCAIMMLTGGGEQSPRGAVRPAVVGTAEQSNIVAIGAAEPHATMTAGIQKGPHHALIVPQQQHGVDSALPRNHIAWPRNLR